MTPDEYKHLKAFADLLDETLKAMRGATSQATLAAAVETYEPRWRGVHDEFADVLGQIRRQVWQIPFAQAKPIAQAVMSHLESTLRDVQAQLKK